MRLRFLRAFANAQIVANGAEGTASEQMEAMGSSTTITWAPEANATPPEVRQLGTDSWISAARQ